MPSFAAPNMTAIGTIGGGSVWNLGQLPVPIGAQQNFTLEIWFKLRGAPATVTLVAQDNGGPQVFALGVNAGTLAGFCATTGFNGTTVLQAGIWYHVAVVCDQQANQLTLYLDGAVEAAVSPLSRLSRPCNRTLA